MALRGIRSHSHDDRKRVIEQLIPLFQKKFGENLLGIAASASYARNEDRTYSDLELAVFVSQSPQKGEDRYLQRIVDGMLVEAMYVTPEEYIRECTAVSPDWYLAGSDRLVPVHNAQVIESIVKRCEEALLPQERFSALAAHQFIEVQECVCKVLNAIEQENREAIGLLLFDAVRYMLIALSFLNRHPFKTFSTFFSEARGFALKPEGLDGLLDVMVDGKYSNCSEIKKLVVAVFGDLEDLFERQGIVLYDKTLDPNVPNRQFD